MTPMHLALDHHDEEPRLSSPPRLMMPPPITLRGMETPMHCQEPRKT
jgi:hypothetical protein